MLKDNCFKIGEDLNSTDTVAGSRYGCYIKLHRLTYFASDSKVVFQWDGYTFENFMKWKWYFRYRAAKLQMENPKQAVEILVFSWKVSAKELEKIAYKNKLIAAKAKLTKIKNKVDAFVKNWNLLFPFDNEPSYLSALSQIEATKEKIAMLEEINEQLSK